MKDPKATKDLNDAMAAGVTGDELESLHIRLTRQNDEYLKGGAVAEQLTALVNRIGGDDAEIRGFIDRLNSSHRTLQQSAFGVFLRWAYSLAVLPDGWYDLRNQAAVESAKKIKATLGEYGSAMPFI